MVKLHEISIMESTIDIVLKKAGECNFKTIRKVTLKIGELSGVMDEALNFAFNELKNYSMLRDAELCIDKIKAKAYCKNCDINYDIDHFNKFCPICAEFPAKIVSGYELYLYSIEGE
ncbi:hydrogenase maturation nickel metallochaperone HypA [Clostridium sp. JS66]|uniref:hydrogenase maturation nickel metallochaperone HypA/HybF n=1 Tax=Clostridium sp. JS66 TaxID=3064705 RepID=UPI00298D6A22|nr:hydrogenase maturation nickel metallochaperone HypA [Clostridium sp. JS66]WPC44452.1 hydrogenase maturation nickel metallochaperone HypA [Clostridium sp. JS66]